MKIVTERLIPKESQLPDILNQIRDKEIAFQGNNIPIDDKTSSAPFSELNRKSDM